MVTEGSQPDSRRRILEHLKRHGDGSVAELSRALRLTPVTIRHHLDLLRREGLVGKPVPRRRPTPGRPEMVYTLTFQADDLLPRNYGELCTCLLESLETALTAEQVDHVLASAGERAGRKAPLRRDKDLEGRLPSVLRFLDARGYYPAWEARQNGGQLRLANCPYLAAVRATPSLCRFDVALLRNLLGVPVSLTGRIIDRQPVCTVQVGSSTAS
jgi:predicted ArsR family transcriptional regulator